MNKTPKEGVELIKSILSETSKEEQAQLVVLPSALTAGAVADAMQGSELRWGGQNCYFENKGAFTGENSPETLASMGARFCLVGHSERRQIFLEGDDFLAKKVVAVQKQGMIPIVCVGETLDDRKWRRNKEVIGRQLKNDLSLASREHEVWVAYEPVWAIGTGQVATPDQVEESHSLLRETLVEVMGSARSSHTPILYGGSVKPENSATLRSLANVSGFLIGGASLTAAEFLKIYRTS